MTKLSQFVTNMKMSGEIYLEPLQEYVESRAVNAEIGNVQSDGTVQIYVQVEEDVIGLVQTEVKRWEHFLFEGKIYPIDKEGNVLYDAPVSL